MNHTYMDRYLKSRFASTVKKMVEKIKDFKAKNLSVHTFAIKQLQSAQVEYFSSQSANPQSLPPFQVNNVKHNPPILTESIIIIMNLLIVICVIIHSNVKIVEDPKDNNFAPYTTWIFTKLFFDIFLLRIVLTLVCTFYDIHFQSYLKCKFFPTSPVLIPPPPPPSPSPFNLFSGSHTLSPKINIPLNPLSLEQRNTVPQITVSSEIHCPSKHSRLPEHDHLTENIPRRTLSPNTFLYTTHIVPQGTLGSKKELLPEDSFHTRNTIPMIAFSADIHHPPKSNFSKHTMSPEEQYPPGFIVESEVA
jgi:hypothetical protein